MPRLSSRASARQVRGKCEARYTRCPVMSQIFTTSFFLAEPFAATEPPAAHVDTNGAVVGSTRDGTAQSSAARVAGRPSTSESARLLLPAHRLPSSTTFAKWHDTYPLARSRRYCVTAMVPARTTIGGGVCSPHTLKHTGSPGS